MCLLVICACLFFVSNFYTYYYNFLTTATVKRVLVLRGKNFLLRGSPQFFSIVTNAHTQIKLPKPETKDQLVTAPHPAPQSPVAKTVGGGDGATKLMIIANKPELRGNPNDRNDSSAEPDGINLNGLVLTNHEPSSPAL